MKISYISVAILNLTFNKHLSEADEVLICISPPIFCQILCTIYSDSNVSGDMMFSFPCKNCFSNFNSY